MNAPLIFSSIPAATAVGRGVGTAFGAANDGLANATGIDLGELLQPYINQLGLNWLSPQPATDYFGTLDVEGVNIAQDDLLTYAAMLHVLPDDDTSPELDTAREAARLALQRHAEEGFDLEAFKEAVQGLTEDDSFAQGVLAAANEHLGITLHPDAEQKLRDEEARIREAYLSTLGAGGDEAGAPAAGAATAETGHTITEADMDQMAANLRTMSDRAAAAGMTPPTEEGLLWMEMILRHEARSSMGWNTNYLSALAVTTAFEYGGATVHISQEALNAAAAAYQESGAGSSEDWLQSFQTNASAAWEALTASVKAESIPAFTDAGDAVTRRTLQEIAENCALVIGGHPSPLAMRSEEPFLITLEELQELHQSNLPMYIRMVGNDAFPTAEITISYGHMMTNALTAEGYASVRPYAGVATMTYNPGLGRQHPIDFANLQNSPMAAFYPDAVNPVMRDEWIEKGIGVASWAGQSGSLPSLDVDGPDGLPAIPDASTPSYRDRG